MRDRDTEIGGEERQYPDTLWTVILDSAAKDSGDYRDKFMYLVSMYWKPVYIYIRYGWKKSNEDAKDLTQEFFARVMQKDSLKHVSPERGKFRTYLQVALKHFMLGEKEKRGAKKRGGDIPAISFDSLQREPSDVSGAGDPVGLFDKEWARAVLDRSLEILEGELKRQGKDIYYRILKRKYELGDDNSSSKYSDMAEEFGLKESDIRNHLVHARSLLRRILREEINSYVADKSEIDGELKYLLTLIFIG